LFWFGLVCFGFGFIYYSVFFLESKLFHFSFSLFVEKFFQIKLNKIAFPLLFKKSLTDPLPFFVAKIFLFFLFI
jgi:hypothetical protein